jgi:hypothetical protein
MPSQNNSSDKGQYIIKAMAIAIIGENSRKKNTVISKYFVLPSFGLDTSK